MSKTEDLHYLHNIVKAEKSSQLLAGVIKIMNNDVRDFLRSRVDREGLDPQFEAKYIVAKDELEEAYMKMSNLLANASRDVFWNKVKHVDDGEDTRK